jgi:hypothetical protein
LEELLIEACNSFDEILEDRYEHYNPVDIANKFLNKPEIQLLINMKDSDVSREGE